MVLLEEASRIVFIGDSEVWVLFDTFCCVVTLLGKTVVARFSFCRIAAAGLLVVTEETKYLFNYKFFPCNLLNLKINCSSKTCN